MIREWENFAMRHIALTSSSIWMSVLAVVAFSSLASADDEGVQITRQPFVEISWDSVNASRYEVRDGSRRLMAGTRLSHLLEPGAPIDEISVHAIRFEGDGVDVEFTEVQEAIPFEIRDAERFVIDWDPDVYERPYIGVRAGYEGPVDERGAQIHLAQQRPFRIAPEPDQVEHVVFGAGVENEDGSVSAPFVITAEGFEARGSYRKLETP
jgi:hypothetical protein